MPSLPTLAEHAPPREGPPEPFPSPPIRTWRSTARTRSVQRVLALAERYRRAELVAKRGRLWAVKATIVAPARAARETLSALRTYAQDAEQDGISRVRQAAWLWWLNLRHNFSAEEVYRYRLFSVERALPRPNYLRWEAGALLFRLLNQRVSRVEAETLADKRRFAAWCEQQGLPTPPILMAFEGGKVTRGYPPDREQPRTDLFAKWGTQFGGDATQRWQFDGEGWLDDDGGHWSFEGIARELAERSRQGVILLQPRLENHSALRPLSPRALSTIRVMTIRRPGEAPRLLAAVLRMGTGSATADNFAQGGIASAVDAVSGVIGEARSLDKLQRTTVHETHPDTGARIGGFALPFWPESVQLALDAHARLGNIACVGWDVAVLHDGPVLLEGNWNPCTKLLQVATQTPLLATEFAETYAGWLGDPACAVDDRWFVEHAKWSPV